MACKPGGRKFGMETNFVHFSIKRKLRNLIPYENFFFYSIPLVQVCSRNCLAECVGVGIPTAKIHVGRCKQRLCLLLKRYCCGHRWCAGQEVVDKQDAPDGVRDGALVGLQVVADGRCQQEWA